MAVVLQYTIQYNTQKNKKTQNNTYTLKTIHNTKLQTQCTKGKRSKKQYDKRNIHMYKKKYAYVQKEISICTKRNIHMYKKKYPYVLEETMDMS